jgi:EAL domain-containing protein (putative c-di-GMP-specific phosphodiesterase class I)
MKPPAVSGETGFSPDYKDRSIDVPSIIEAESIHSEYQPIVSVRDRRIIGLEALARATDPRSGEPIRADLLFALAAEQGCSLELDRLCRRRALKGFAESCVYSSDAVCFVNIETSILTRGIVGSNMVRDLVEEQGMEPGRIVLEILESDVEDARALHDFVESYRKQGFLIALDDMGTGHSNLERISDIKPDIIKLDRSLIVGIEDEYHKRELLDFFMQLSGKIGVTAIAEGVETQAQAHASLDRGADIMQGFLFACPGPISHEALEATIARASEISASFKEYESRRIAERKQLFRYYDGIASGLCGRLESHAEGDYETALESGLADLPNIECAYVLDKSGRQISGTIFNPQRARRRSSAIYAPSAVGDDQSAKDYFLFIDKDQLRYVTDPYISRATGAICVTISSALSDASGAEIILCLDIDMPNAL